MTLFTISAERDVVKVLQVAQEVENLQIRSLQSGFTSFSFLSFLSNLKSLSISTTIGLLLKFAAQLPAKLQSFNYTYSPNSEFEIDDDEKASVMKRVIQLIGDRCGGSLLELSTHQVRIPTNLLLSMSEIIPNLKKLTLYDAELDLFHQDAAFMQSLTRWKSLTSLDLGGLNIYTSGDDVVRLVLSIPNASRLQTLEFSEMRFSDLSDILQMNCKALCLDDIKPLDQKNQPSHVDFVVLKHNSVLESISMTGAPFMGNELLTRKLATCKSLTRINLSRCDLSDYAVNQLFRLPDLKTLIIDDNQQVEFSTSNLLKHEQSISYESDSEYEDIRTLLMDGYKSLETLSIMHIVPCEEGVEILRKLPGLKHLNMMQPGDRSLTPTQFLQLLQSDSLKVLDVRGHSLLKNSTEVNNAISTSDIQVRL